MSIPRSTPGTSQAYRSEEHTSELQSRSDLVCRLLLEKKKIATPHLATRGHHTIIHRPTPPSAIRVHMQHARHTAADQLTQSMHPSPLARTAMCVVYRP